MTHFNAWIASSNNSESPEFKNKLVTFCGLQADLADERQAWTRHLQVRVKVQDFQDLVHAQAKKVSTDNYSKL